MGKSELAMVVVLALSGCGLAPPGRVAGASMVATGHDMEGVCRGLEEAMGGLEPRAGFWLGAEQKARLEPVRGWWRRQPLGDPRDTYRF